MNATASRAATFGAATARSRFSPRGLISPLTAAQLVAFGTVAVVVMDSPLGAIGRVTGLGVAIVGSLMVMLVGSAGPAWRSVAAAAGGSVGAVVGLGYGSQRLAEGNLWLGLPIIGAASVSLGVLVIGSYRAIRSTPGWWRLLAIPIAFVLLQFGLMPATFGTLGTHGWRSPVTAAAPAGASTVSVVSLDGVELQAWYLPGRNGAAVVLLPGAGGNRASAVSHALALADLGYGVLAMDARGTGDSGGHNNLWGWEGTKDISAAVAWLDGQPEVRDGRIGLVGLSMGGEQALTAAPEVPGVRAVVSEGVQARGPDDLWYLRDGIRARIERIVAAVQWTVADLWTDASPPPSLRDVATRLGDAPVLIIAADAFDERTVAADLAQRAAVVEVWQTSGVGHTGSLAADPDAWSRRVGDFLDRALDQ